jgi:quercetin dioxygenase-like cupin family protein
VVEGRGSTEVWIEGQSKKHVFEWQKGSMFSIPMNAMHRHVNATSGGALLLQDGCSGLPRLFCSAMACTADLDV